MLRITEKTKCKVESLIKDSWLSVSLFLAFLVFANIMSIPPTPAFIIGGILLFKVFIDVLTSAPTYQVPSGPVLKFEDGYISPSEMEKLISSLKEKWVISIKTEKHSVLDEITANVKIIVRKTNKEKMKIFLTSGIIYTTMDDIESGRFSEAFQVLIVRKMFPTVGGAFSRTILKRLNIL